MIENYMLDTAKLIYLDNHSTTPVDSRVVTSIVKHMEVDFGNASSVDHILGDKAQLAIESSLYQVSQLIQADPKEIIFTSGATESINLAIQGHVNHLAKLGIKPCIVISACEHKAVFDTCEALKQQGKIKLLILGVDERAKIDLSQLEKIFDKNQVNLLCIMAANNEVGSVYPIDKMSTIARSYNVPFLCDATQAVGKIPIKFQDWGITMLALSAHKFYGPKGVGALVVQKDQNLEPLFYGGGHQRGLRSGTLNVSGIVGLGEACRLRQLEMKTDEAAIAIRRNKLQTLLCEAIPEIIVNGDIENRLAGNLHISIPGIPNSAIIARVRHKLAISTGAACSSGVEAPSHVLTAMGLPEDIVEGALRISLGKFTTDEDVINTANILSTEIKTIQNLMM